jgi:hypothetical protein
MFRTCLLSLAIVLPSLAVAQNVTVQTDKGGVDVQTGSGNVTVKKKGKKTKVSAGGATTEVETSGEGDSTAVSVGTSGGTTEVKTSGGAKKAKKSAGGGGLGGLDALTCLDAGFMVDGQDKKVSHVCPADEDVAVSGQGNQVALSGPCRKVCVSGHKNRVTVEKAGAIDASGDKNSVKWKSGLDGDPKIMRSGFDNTVDKVE